MDKLTLILVVASRTKADRMLLEKAVDLARHMGAQISLFSCDADLGRAIHRSYSSEDAEKAWHISEAEHLAYLNLLRASVSASDVQISVAAECYSPLYEGILNKVRELQPDLLMKTPSGEHPLRRFTFGPSDWRLMRECPTTLMLVRQHRWKTPPTFAALVDVSDETTARLAETIVHTSEHFALGSGGQLDVLYSETSADVVEKTRRSSALQRLTHEYHIPAAHIHVLTGDPDTTLADFAAGQRYDALILGGLTHRKGIAPLVGTLTGKLVEALDSDFILVKRESSGGFNERREPQADRSANGTSVLWSAAFGD